jgi:hypothetical protein
MHEGILLSVRGVRGISRGMHLGMGVWAGESTGTALHLIVEVVL